MNRLRVGMRWWLAGGFAAIAVLTAVLTTAVASRQVSRDVTANAREIAIGQTVSAGFDVERAIRNGRLNAQTRASGRRYGLSLFVFSRQGTLIASAPVGRGWASVPSRQEALARALAGRRFVAGFGTATLVALPLRRTSTAAALVAYAPRPGAYGRSLSIFHSETIRAAIWAALAAAAAGLLLAWLVARRLRRIASAAQAIERGVFDGELNPRFRDEIGELAAAVDAMRRRLGRAFTQLEAERDRLELLLDRLHEGVIAVDEQLAVQYANASMRRRLPGLERGADLPATLEGLPLRALASQLFVQHAPVAEARSDAADGSTYALVGIPAAGTELAVLVLADITADERHRRAEREFVANASHELRTPVSAIASAVEALELGARHDPAERDRFIRLIGRQAQRLTRLTHSLLVLARAQTREQDMPLVPVELGPFLERAAQAEPDGRVTVDALSAPAALAQPEVLEQVVANLLANAVKHAAGRDIVLRACPEGEDAVAIEVADGGPGIPADVRARVFERFYAGGESRDGFGLGLAIARESALAMHGRLDLDSEPGTGTTARVVLRRA
jgi:two-component system sensor histidine kinase VicK